MINEMIKTRKQSGFGEEDEYEEQEVDDEINYENAY